MGFTSGRFPHRWILWLHGIGAYTLMLLFFWKGSVIVDAMRRKKKWTGKRLGFAVATLLLAMVLAAGLLGHAMSETWLYQYSPPRNR